MDPSRESGVGEILLVDRVRPETYRVRSEQVKQQRECEFFVAKSVEQMRQSGELLESDHSMYTQIKEIVRKLGHQQEVDLYLSLNDALQAYTVKDGKTLVFSVGLFEDFEKYLQTKGKHLTQDHMALIIAHELSHWDSGAQTTHLAENYCDTNGFFMADRAGYNSECLAEALEFLESIQKQEEGAYGDRDIQIIPITHPSSESRRILAQTIVNDPDIHLHGRISDLTDFDQKTYSDFREKGRIWLNSVRSRRMIASENDVERELENAQTASQLFEVFLAADDYYHAKFVEDFSKTPAFDNILLAMAVYSGAGASYPPMLLVEDFYMQWKQRLMAKKKSANEITALEESYQGHLFCIDDYHNSEALLIQRILKGDFKNPLEILTSDQETLRHKYPEFAQIDFNNFFENLKTSLERFIQYDGISSDDREILEKSYPERLDIIGLDKDQILSNSKLAVSDEISVEVAQIRSELLDKLRVAFSAMIVRSAQWYRKSPDPAHPHRRWAHWAVSEYETRRGEIDYSVIQNKIADRLITIGHCQTTQAAQNLSSIIVSGGYHSNNLIKNSHEDWLSDAYSTMNLDSVITPDVASDIEHGILSLQLSLTQGGKELGELFGLTRILKYNLSLRHYFADLLVDSYSRDNLDNNSELSIFNILNNRWADLNIPYVAESRKDDEETASKPSLFYVFSNYVQKNNNRLPEALVQNPILLKQLILESVEHRAHLHDLILASKDYRGQIIASNTTFVDDVLSDGVMKNCLTPEEINTILKHAKNINLYNKYLPYLQGEPISDYYQLWLEEFEKQPDQHGCSRAEIIARFVEAGGVIGYYPEGAILDELSQHNYEQARSQIYSESEFLGKRILAVVNDEAYMHTNEQRNSLLDVAALLIGHAKGLHYKNPDSYQVYQQNPPWQDFPSRIESIDQWLNVLAQLPKSRIRDAHLSDVLLGVYKWGNIQQGSTGIFDLEDKHIRRVLQMFSENAYRKAEIQSDTKLIVTIPLVAKSIDIRKKYPLNGQLPNPFVLYLEAIADRREENSVVKNMNLIEKLDDVISLIPLPCAVRDYFIERTLLPMLDETVAVTSMNVEEQIQLLEKAQEVAFSERTRGIIAEKIVRYRLNELGQNLTFENGIKIITKHMSHASASRDQFITELMTLTDTTWEQIDRTEKLLLGYSFATDREDVRSRNAAFEGISYCIERMSTEDRKEFFLFLLSPEKHVLSEDQLTADFFDTRVRKRMRRQLLRSGQTRHGLRNLDSAEEKKAIEFLSEHEQYKQEIDKWIAYLLAKFVQKDAQKASQMTISTDDPTDQFMKNLQFVDLLGWATPESLNELLNNPFQREPTSTTSLGPLFMSSSRKDRRAIIYRLCLGQNGFFEDRRFESDGVGLIEETIEKACNVSSTSASEFSQQEVQMLKDIVITLYSQLSPVRRTEVLSRMVNLIVDHGGRVSRSELFKIGLSAFGVVGAKIGQMEALIPAELREELSSLKEDVPPIPKVTVEQMLRIADRTHAYEGIGPVLGGASTATVYELLEREGADDDVVGKFIRPEAAAVVDSDLLAVERTIRILKERGILKVNPEPILAELRTMVAEELDPSYERSNTRVIHVARRKSQAGIDTPEIIHSSARHIEMTKASGISLRDIRQIQHKHRSDEDLTEEEKKYLTVDLQSASKTIVQDFFYGVFRLGIWHTDLHDGNIFITPDGTITIIDHGQVGFEDDPVKREGLFRFMAGVALQDNRVTAEAIAEFVPDLSDRQIYDLLSYREGTLLERASSVIAELGVRGSLNRFTKALVSAKPVLDQIDSKTLLRMCIPYAVSKKTLMPVAKTASSLLRRRISRNTAE